MLIYAKVFVWFSRAQRHPVGLCEYSFSKFGRRAQRRPLGLIVSALIFSIFSFVSSFVLFICIYHEYTHPMVFSHTNRYPNLSFYLKSQFPILKDIVQFQNDFPIQFKFSSLSSSQNIPSY